MALWEYAVFEPKGGLSAEAILIKLNELGQQGWECYDIYRGSTRFDNGFVELHCKRKIS